MNKIIELQVENVMGIKLFHIKPDGNAIVLGGENEAGKSSVLDSICMLIGGGKLAVPEPLRRGQTRGKIVADLGEVIATRFYEKRPDGSTKTTLELKSKDGYDAPTPQAILNDMGVLFDPLEFSRLKPKEQFVALQNLVGLDFTELDQKRASIYATRTNVNALLKQRQALLVNTVRHEDAPLVEVSAAELMVELQKRREINAKNAGDRAKLTEANREIQVNLSRKQAFVSAVESARRAMEAAEARLAAHEDSMKAFAESTEDIRKHVESLVDENESEVMERIKGAEEVNRKVRANIQYAAIEEEVQSLRKKTESLTDEIKELDSSRTKQLAEAKFPVPGLGFGPEGITFNELPFEQASSAVKIRTSVAMGIASKPGGRVMLIREGSLLNMSNLQLVEDMVTAADCQVWIERVSVGKECTVILEDGEIAQPAEAESAAAS